MLAFALSVGLLIFWNGVGYAILGALRREGSQLQNALLAPVVGIAATLLPLFWLSRLGLPVMRFGWLLLVGLLLLSVGLLWRFRPVYPVRRMLPFIVVFALAFILTGRPLLEFGFNWLSYSNDDFANYALSAQRLAYHGYFDVPNIDDLVQGKSYSSLYWSLTVPLDNRPGADLLLAWNISLTGLESLQIFMPVILAFHIALISAVGALVYQSRRYLLAAWLTCLLVSLSALTSLGTLYQLIAQVLGLGLLLGTAVAAFYLVKIKNVRMAFRHGVLLALLTAALMIAYPEITPFLGLAFILYIVWITLKRTQIIRSRSMVIYLLIAGVLTLVMLNDYTRAYINFLLGQTSFGSTTNADATGNYIFSYYLLPSGLSDLWGLQSIRGFSADPWLSISIVVGGSLLILTLFATGLCLYRKEPVAFIAVPMFGLIFYCFARQLDFALFKLAMYIQPFLLGTLVVAWLTVWPRHHLRWKIVPLLALGLAGLYGQADYLEASRGFQSSGLNELPKASPSALVDKFKQLMAENKADHLQSDTPNLVLAKFEAVSTEGIATEFVNRQMLLPGSFGPNPQMRLTFQTHFLPNAYTGVANDLALQYSSNYVQYNFNLHDLTNPALADPFYLYTATSNALSENSAFVLSNPDQTLFNHYWSAMFNGAAFIELPADQIHNYLMFVNSQFGLHYYLHFLGTRGQVAIYQPETDYFFPNKSMIAVGRYLLFEVVNPATSVRVRLDMTASLNHFRGSTLPPAAAIGTDRALFPLIGRGAARVFSPPLTPQLINGRYYIAIDMGIDAQQIGSGARSGLMRLYGTNVNLDIRSIVGFARDISVVPDADYSALTPPGAIAKFPEELGNPALEFSGIYEDGWFSENVFMNLMQTKPGDQFLLCGSLPLIDDSKFTTQVQILIDGQLAKSQDIHIGNVEIRVPSSNPGRHRIDVRFSTGQQLPGQDGRSVTILAKSIGFQPAGGSCQ